MAILRVMVVAMRAQTGMFLMDYMVSVFYRLAVYMTNAMRNRERARLIVIHNWGIISDPHVIESGRISLQRMLERCFPNAI